MKRNLEKIKVAIFSLLTTAITKKKLEKIVVAILFLLATSALSSSIKAETQNVIMTKPPPQTKASFTYSPLFPFVNENVTFNASTSTARFGDTVYSYEWNFNAFFDQTIDRTVHEPITTYRFDRPIDFNVSLTVRTKPSRNSTELESDTTWQIIRIYDNPTPNDLETSEYLTGIVGVSVIMFESNGTIDPSTEDWNATEEEHVKNQIKYALGWWASQNPSANITFKYDFRKFYTYREPINMYFGETSKWTDEAMAYYGVNVSVMNPEIEYVSNVRRQLHTDWAFLVYVVDASNDEDGLFKWNWTSPPVPTAQTFMNRFIIEPYKPTNFSSLTDQNFGRVFAHEFGHIFYATDEYDNFQEYRGYLNASDNDGSGGMMDKNRWYLSEGTKLQVGWRDSDNNGILDVLDTYPKVFLEKYKNPTTDTKLVYAGLAVEQAYPNTNPGPKWIPNWQRNVTLNKIKEIAYRIDSGPWTPATTDGSFDEAAERFTIETPELSIGKHTIEVYTVNSLGRMSAYASDTVTIVVNPVVIGEISASTALTNEIIRFDASKSYDADGYIVKYYWNFGDGTNATDSVVDHSYTDDGSYSVTLTVTDNDGLSNTAYAVISILNRPSVAIFTQSRNIAYLERDQITFNASDSYDLDGRIVRYYWDFGDGESAMGMLTWIIHTYDTEGNFTVFLTITDDDGVTSNATSKITVRHLHDMSIMGVKLSATKVYRNETINVSIDIINSGTANETFDVVALYDENVIDVKRIFSLNRNGYAWVTFIWNTTNAPAGNYTLSIRISEIPEEADPSDNNKTYQIIVMDYPTAFFTYSPETPLVDKTVIFNATLSNPNGGTIIDYTWDFGDGSHESGAIVYHNYSKTGTYNIVLKVTDSEELTNTTFAIISVYMHDIAIVNITSPTNEIHGETMNISVIIQNNGNFTETFNVVIYANATTIQKQEVHLTPTDQVTLIFSWNTKGISFGNYTIRAEADVVDGETYTANNIIGLVLVKRDSTPPTVGMPVLDPPKDNVGDGQAVKVSVNITDMESGVKNVTLLYTVDNETWENRPMNNQSTLYEATIPGQLDGTWVEFKILAYDYAGNNVTMDGAEPYFIYRVIPEFQSYLMLVVLFTSTLMAMLKRRHLKKQKMHS